MIAREIRNVFALLSRLKRCVPLVLRGAGNRADLAALEFEEAWRAAVMMLVAGAVMVGVAGLALCSVTLLVAAIFWDTPYRVTALAVLTGAELGGALAAVLWLRARWKNWEPFQALREQINKDVECLEKILPPREN